MNSKFIQTRWAQRLASLTATTIIAGLPFLTVTESAQADPPRHAPAWGYRDRDDDDDDDKKRHRRKDRNGRWNRNDRYDRDRYNRDRYNRDRYNRDRYNRDRYNNDRYNNDRYGSWGREGVRYNFGGVVTSEIGNGRFVMRADNGRTVTVYARQRNVADRIDRGDRVVVAGYFRNNIFDAEDVNFTYNR